MGAVSHGGNAMLMGIVLLAVSAVAASPEKGPGGSACPRVEIHATGQDGAAHLDRGGRSAGPVFSAATAGDLEFRLSVAPRLSGRRAVLKVYTPKGHLYQELGVALEQTGPAHHRIVTRLPVSGTLIVNSSLYGHWSLATHLDGSREACGKPSRFTITP